MEWAFWAKLPKDQKAPRGYHPVLCHLIDVAAVTDAMWHHVLTPASRMRVAATLGITEEATVRWVAFLAGLHDIGKVSPPFQLQVSATDPEVVTRLRQAGFDEAYLGQPGTNTPHGIISTIALEHEILNAEPYRLDRQLIPTLATLIGGHHGLFPTANELKVPNAVQGQGPWREARRKLTKILGELLEVPTQERPTSLNHPTAMILAGLISVADWIGSDPHYFPLACLDALSNSPLDPRTYHQAAKRQAMEALRHLGWLGWTPDTKQLDFPTLFNGKTPRGAQGMAIELAEDLDAPALVIVEAPMGEGKTEAAMYMADRWSVRHGLAGSYFALPTQASSNQMFDRVRDFLHHRYPDQVVNLQLLHGHADLSAAFEELRAGYRLLGPRNIWDQGTGGAVTHDGDVVAAEWFTHRKRGLLAPFGVGTIDQSLLAALQTKHVFVRLFALSHKTVIIDEVHAYDTYMTTLLERLLEWLAALGSSVVLLSATLPRTRREALLTSYSKGLGGTIPAIVNPDYPRVTWVSSTKAGACQVPSDVGRTLRLKRVDGTCTPASHGFPLGRELRDTLGDRGSVAIICNTVRRAQQVYLALQPLFPGVASDGYPTLDLLHSRYLFKDRQEREQRALLRFGKDSAMVDTGGGVQRVNRPRRAILVATQIIEQSLDLDFDVMITDIAPLDLILQRSGRLWRHSRDWRPAWMGDAPELWICMPSLSAEGLPEFEQGFERIYDSHVLLRSWLALRDRDKVSLPQDMDTLIESVYQEGEPHADLDEVIRAKWCQTREKSRKEVKDERDQARDSWLKQPGDCDADLSEFTLRPRQEDKPDIDPVHQALTRLTELNVQVICLDASQTARFRQAPTNPDSLRVLLSHAVRLTDWRVVKPLLKAEAPPGWRQSAVLRHYRLLILDGGRGEVDGHPIFLHPELGLIVGEL